jgi:hypothetical protein
VASVYFALENEKTKMSIGIAGSTCAEGIKLELQTTVYCIPNQQFTLQGKRLISFMCPRFSISKPLDCKDAVQLQLSRGTDSEWLFNSEVQSIESSSCPGMLISVDNVKTSWIIRMNQYAAFVSEEPPFFNNSTEMKPNSTSVDNNLPKVGSPIVMLPRPSGSYQSWTQKHQCELQQHCVNWYQNRFRCSMHSWFMFEGTH